MNLRNRGLRTLAMAGLVAAVTVGGGASAIAASHAASTTGARAVSSGNSITVYDTKADGDWVRGNWNTSSGGGGVDNKSGADTRVVKNVGSSVTAVQACKSRVSLPMVCSSWNNEY